MSTTSETGTTSPLEDGWQPTTPADDTYLRRFLLNWAGNCAAMARAHGGGVREGASVHMADSGRPVAFANCATLLRPLRAESAAAEMAAIADFFGFADPRCSGEVLLVSAWPTGDLRPFGWSLMGHPPVHLLPTGATPRPAPPELRIAEVRGDEALRDWERVVIAGYPVDELAASPPGSLLPSTFLEEPASRLWVGYVDDEPVCASSAWTTHGINDVTLVATLPQARRRGYGEALTWHASLADPALPAMLLSSDDGRPVYERMGYLALLRLTLWYRTRVLGC